MRIGGVAAIGVAIVAAPAEALAGIAIAVALTVMSDASAATAMDTAPSFRIRVGDSSRCLTGQVPAPVPGDLGGYAVSSSQPCGADDQRVHVLDIDGEVVIRSAEHHGCLFGPGAAYEDDKTDEIPGPVAHEGTTWMVVGGGFGRCGIPRGDAERSVALTEVDGYVKVEFVDADLCLWASSTSEANFGPAPCGVSTGAAEWRMTFDPVSSE